jgi:uncharacterized protein (TIGR04255 family)
MLPMTASAEGHPTLARAPITEAMIDIRVEQAPGASPDDLRALHPFLAVDYPQIAERKSLAVRIRGADPQMVTRSAPTPDGFFFKSTDGRQVVQARSDGFAFSRLRPYKSWSGLRLEAQRLWDQYARVTKPARIVRVGVRYVNRIDLPQPFNTDDYFRTTLHLPDELPQLISSMFLRFSLMYPEGTADVTLAIASDTPPDAVAVIFDIDVSRELSLAPASTEVWALLDRFRLVKNDIFFNSLTPRTLELFR